MLAAVADKHLSSTASSSMNGVTAAGSATSSSSQQQQDAPVTTSESSPPECSSSSSSSSLNQPPTTSSTTPPSRPNLLTSVLTAPSTSLPPATSNTARRVPRKHPYPCSATSSSSSRRRGNQLVNTNHDDTVPSRRVRASSIASSSTASSSINGGLESGAASSTSSLTTNQSAHCSSNMLHQLLTGVAQGQVRSQSELLMASSQPIPPPTSRSTPCQSPMLWPSPSSTQDNSGLGVAMAHNNPSLLSRSINVSCSELMGPPPQPPPPIRFGPTPTSANPVTDWLSSQTSSSPAQLAILLAVLDQAYKQQQGPPVNNLSLLQLAGLLGQMVLTNNNGPLTNSLAGIGSVTNNVDHELSTILTSLITKTMTKNSIGQSSSNPLTSPPLLMHPNGSITTIESSSSRSNPSLPTPLGASAIVVGATDKSSTTNNPGPQSSLLAQLVESTSELGNDGDKHPISQQPITKSNSDQTTPIASLSTNNNHRDSFRTLYVCDRESRLQAFNWLVEADLYVADACPLIGPGVLLASAVNSSSKRALIDLLLDVRKRSSSRKREGSRRKCGASDTRHLVATILSNLWPRLLMVGVAEHAGGHPMRSVTVLEAASVTEAANGCLTADSSQPTNRRDQLIDCLANLIQFELEASDCSSSLGRPANHAFCTELAQYCSEARALALDTSVYDLVRRCILAQYAYPTHFATPYVETIKQLERHLDQQGIRSKFAALQGLLNHAHCFDSGTLKQFFCLADDSRAIRQYNHRSVLHNSAANMQSSPESSSLVESTSYSTSRSTSRSSSLTGSTSSSPPRPSTLNEGMARRGARPIAAKRIRLTTTGNSRSSNSSKKTNKHRPSSIRRRPSHVNNCNTDGEKEDSHPSQIHAGSRKRAASSSLIVATNSLLFDRTSSIAPDELLPATSSASRSSDGGSLVSFRSYLAPPSSSNASSISPPPNNDRQYIWSSSNHRNPPTLNPPPRPS